MFQFNKLINVISLAAILGTGMLFIIKYSYRVIDAWGIPVAIAFSVILYLILMMVEKRTREMKIVQFKGKLYPLVIYFGVIFILGMFVLDLDTRVARYYAINEWLELFAVGKFPYTGETNPSGFPFLFLTALPFYYIGNTGLIVPIGITLLAITVLYEKKTLREIALTLNILLLTPMVYYEYLTKSELIYNMALGIGLIAATTIKKADEQRNLFHYILAIGWGAVLSTRLVMIVPYLLFMLYFYRTELKQMILSAAVTSIVFLIFVLPFVFWNSKAFFSTGPFAIQMIYLPVIFYIVVPIMLIYAGWMISNHQELYFASGLTIFMLVLTSFFITIFEEGIFGSVLRDRFDISYFIMPIPFFLMAIREYSIDRYLGRVYISKQEEE